MRHTLPLTFISLTSWESVFWKSNVTMYKKHENKCDRLKEKLAYTRKESFLISSITYKKRQKKN
jgi:hypothetical protein